MKKAMPGIIILVCKKTILFIDRGLKNRINQLHCSSVILLIYICNDWIIIINKTSRYGYTVYRSVFFDKIFLCGELTGTISCTI